MLNGGLRQQNGSQDIHVEHSVEVRFGDLLKRGEGVNA